MTTGNPRVSRRPALLAAALLAAAGALGHGDEKPLFVAANGADRGRCQDAAAPCRTLEYALGRAGKGGQVRVGSGRFDLGDPEALFPLLAGIVELRGGFAADFRQAGQSETMLTGVPAEYRALFASRGFHVLSDRKGSDPVTARELQAKLDLHSSMQTEPLAAAPCSGGASGGLACDRAALLAHVPFGSVSASPAAAADVWGFVDLNSHREYVIVGYNIGTGVFDVTDPATPREVGFVDGLNTTWRDIKVYQYYDEGAGRWHAYAYVTTDGASDGLFVIDLGGLPHSIARVGYGSDFSAAHNVFAVHTDYATGLSLTGATPGLVVAGSNNGGGRFRAYSLADPAAPAFAAMPAGFSSDYMHDAASVLVRDTRKDTQCVNAGDYCELLFDFNESTVDIWDITDGTEPVRLSRTPYSNSAYTHSGWPSEDGMYLFVHDELDEQDFGLNTTLRVFSLANLAAPAEIGAWQGPSRAIDHNGFVRGSRYYMSNYTRGLTVLDISDPVTPVAAGFLDTYPFSDSSSFSGAWGVYPYLPSGVLAVSDINSGLYLVGDETLTAPAGMIKFTADSFAGEEGGALAVSLERSGGSTDTVTVTVDVLPATADFADAVPASRTASWGDGESGVKTILFDLPEDAAAEGLEQLLVKLVAPSGRSTLASPSLASVYVADARTPAEVGFDRAEAAIAERGFGTAILVVQRAGSAAGAASAYWSVTGGTAIAGGDFGGAAAGTVAWAAGDATPRSIEFPVADDGTVEDDEYFEVGLTSPSGAVLGANATARVTLLDGAGRNRAPIAVAGASMSVSPGDAVTLDGSGSTDPDDDALSFAWQQTLGPAVALADAATASARFTAPTVTSDTLLGFELTVTDPRGLADSATTSVTVRATDGGSGGGAVGWLWLLALAGAWARSHARQWPRTRRATRTGAS